MARDIQSGMQAELAADEIHPILLFEGIFDGGDVRFWTGVGTLSWNGHTWDGGGEFLGFSGITETGATQAEGATVSLNGIPSEIVSLTLNEDYQGRACSIYFGALDSSGAVVVDPVKILGGFADTMGGEDGGETATISLSIENDLAALKRPNKQLYTSERQQVDYPSDLGFDFVPALQDQKLQWGATQ